MLGILIWVIAVGIGMAAIFAGASGHKKLQEMLRWITMVIGGIATVISLAGRLNIHGKELVVVTLLILAFGFYCVVLGGIDF